jgi:superfamily II DNA or RNA helicase
VFSLEFARPVGRLGDGIIDLQPVTVATLQTAARVFDMKPPPARKDEEDDAPQREKPTRLDERRAQIVSFIENAGMVIFDECHHVPADTAYDIAFRTLSARYRFGLSATPWRDDGHDLLLEAALGPKVCAMTCSDLIRRGYLVRPSIAMTRAPAPPNLRRRLE